MSNLDKVSNFGKLFPKVELFRVDDIFLVGVGVGVRLVRDNALNSNYFVRHFS